MTATFERGQVGSLFRPNPGYVVVRPVQQKEVTESGLIIPKHINRRDVLGTVVAKGDSTTDNLGRVLDIDLKVGDMVVCARHGGQGWENPQTSDVEVYFYPFGAILARVATTEERNPDSLDNHLATELDRVVV